MKLSLPVAVAVAAALISAAVVGPPASASASEPSVPPTAVPTEAPDEPDGTGASADPSTPQPEESVAPTPAGEEPAAPDSGDEKSGTDAPSEQEIHVAPYAGLGIEADTSATAAFTAGHLISDFNFFNSWAMTESEIQAFLERNVGLCQNEYCLAVYRTNTPNASWSFGTCDPYPGAANESAARIIYKVQRACGLSAKVILVTLQKEQGLITKAAPTSLELRKAMGMGCPDTSVCDSQYYGFFNQVYAAARQLTWYTNPQSSMYQSGKYAVGQVRPIQYHPDVSCGAPGVYINNIATAALYWYTPYQPNANALAAGWGASSDPCASYGNRNFWNYYNLWFGDPTVAPSPNATRLGGSDRFDTAVRISRWSFPATAPVVYVASGRNYPDALAAGAAAVAQGGPLLLVDTGYVPDVTLAELRRLSPASIVLVGGTVAVSSQVESALAAVAKVVRVAGTDRYDTARRIADHAFGTSATAYISTGMDFPDALSASAAAGAKRVPVLLVNGSLPAVDGQTVEQLRRMGVMSVKIVGGVNVMTPGVEQGLRDAGFAVQRLAGADRYLTSVVINRDAFPNASMVFASTGSGFADALAGSAAAAKANSPLYVTQKDCVSAEFRADAQKAQSLVLLGGPAVLSDRVAYLAVC